MECEITQADNGCSFHTKLTHCIPETRKRVIDKQCRPRSAASDQGLRCLPIV